MAKAFLAIREVEWNAMKDMNLEEEVLFREETWIKLVGRREWELTMNSRWVGFNTGLT